MGIKDFQINPKAAGIMLDADLLVENFDIPQDVATKITKALHDWVNVTFAQMLEGSFPDADFTIAERSLLKGFSVAFMHNWAAERMPFVEFVQSISLNAIAKQGDSK